MQEEILFEVTKAKLETGLRGVPVGYCTTSYVDPQKGLFYIDKPVSEIAYWKPIKAIYLLHKGREGSDAEIKDFSKELEERATCPEKVIQSINCLPREGHPMKLLSSSILILGMLETTGDYREDALNLIAKLPHLVAAVINHHAGWGPTPTPKPDVGYIESFTTMLKVPHADWHQLVRTFNLFHTLHIDHGGGNLSAFVGKSVASGLADLYESIASALCALSGPRHGRANQDCLEFVQNVLDEVGEGATEADVEKLIRHRLSQKELVFGFGHAVLRVEDPRATVQYDYLKRHYPHNPLTKIVHLLRTAGPKVLAENPKIASPYPNLDAVSGSMLTISGFAYPEYYTLLFGFSRAVGIAIQIIYERCEARDGKGTPIIRPKYFFKSRS